MTRRMLLGAATAVAPSLPRLFGAPAAPAAPAVNAFSRRYRLTIDRVRGKGIPEYSRKLVLADAIPEAGRRFTEFSGDVSGRYIGALASVAADRKEEFPELRPLVAELIGLQKPQGYFGASFPAEGVSKQDMALLWGNGRLLIGLLEYARQSHDAQALATAKKLGDFVVRIAPELNSEKTRAQFESGAFAMGYICWTQIIEGMVELHRVTGTPRYRSVAEEMARRTERRPSEHSHGFLTSLRGVVDLYEATGDRAFLDRAEGEWKGVIESGNLLTPGSIPEAWKPKAHRTEGCAEADWLRLSLRLWGLTGKTQYLEQAERTLFNEFAMNQFDTGDFGHRVVSRTGSPLGGTDEGGGTARAWWCCTLHGLRAFPDVRAHIFRAQGDRLSYDLPMEGTGEAGGCRFVAESALESAALVRIAVQEASAKAVPLMIRKPSWTQAVRLTVNGAPLTAEIQGGYHGIRRTWKVGDQVEIRYDMRPRVERVDGDAQVTLWHGPWLLGIDEMRNPSFFDEPMNSNRLTVPVLPDGSAELQRDGAPAAGPFSVAQARFRVSYLPGGYPMSPGTAMLSPVAEQTGFRSSAWEYTFQLAGSRAK
ncbi:beta-L-arabinofuranosidase domain-containing protein [uncultured Paludibaculum sp.]|uniref:beta-L-arabinofuranosidase domain-containing protein n=1 Tax=uncultured Paludibaculum sp. TaxID=1765020 RepID=UPI002AABE56F|nr:beta-L-arabinofuranosidase domain-containing protein [uncultured Paludibaculum sp.]